MNFEFSDDEQQLREAVQRWVERGYGFDRRTAIAKAGGFSAEVWGEIAELGLLGLGTSEEDGGMAMGPVAAMLALEAAGHYSAPYLRGLPHNFGAVGPDSAHGVAGAYFNTRKTTIYGGSNEVQRNIVAQTVLGV